MQGVDGVVMDGCMDGLRCVSGFSGCAACCVVVGEVGVTTVGGWGLER